MIFTADLHVHTFKAFADKNVETNTRLLNTLNALNQVRDYAIANGEKEIVIVGDTFETKNIVEAITNNYFSDWVASCNDNSIFVTILVGNHDISSLGNEEITLLHPLKYFGNVKLVNAPLSVQTPFGSVSYVPFRRNQEVVKEMIRSRVEWVKENNKSCVDPQFNILCYHGAVFGAKISNREFLDTTSSITVDDLHPDVFDQIFLGHFHKHQKLAENVRYIGSLLHHDLHDAGDNKGFYHFNAKENILKFVKTKYPAFCVVDINNEEDWATANFDDYNYWYINVQAGVKVPQKFYDKHNFKIHTLTKKERQSRLDVEYSTTAKLDKNQLLEAYTKHTNKTLDLDRLIKLGKGFLNG